MRRRTGIAAAAAALFLPSAPAARAAEQQAYAVGLNYATPVVVASQGDTLRFNNLDPLAQHDIVSDTPGLFASPLIGNGQSALVSGVEKLAPATYQFHCTLHAWMHGAIQVVPASAPSPPPPHRRPAPGARPIPSTCCPSWRRLL